MNAHAASSFERADRELLVALREWQAELDAERSALLMRGHESWKAYADAQARLAASENEGGSIWPTIYFSELKSLTDRRIEEVRQTHEHYRLDRHEA
jgi:uncharacterized protein YecT (DUF1311 family)